MCIFSLWLSCIKSLWIICELNLLWYRSRIFFKLFLYCLCTNLFYRIYLLLLFSLCLSPLLIVLSTSNGSCKLVKLIILKGITYYRDIYTSTVRMAWKSRLLSSLEYLTIIRPAILASSTISAISTAVSKLLYPSIFIYIIVSTIGNSLCFCPCYSLSVISGCIYALIDPIRDLRYSCLLYTSPSPRDRG